MKRYERLDQVLGFIKKDGLPTADEISTGLGCGPVYGVLTKLAEKGCIEVVPIRNPNRHIKNQTTMVDAYRYVKPYHREVNRKASKETLERYATALRRHGWTCEPPRPQTELKLHLNRGRA